MENIKNKSKESYLSKLKNTIIKHFENTIKSEIQEYKDNMEIKYDLPVKTKESLAAYIQDMVSFNNSGKVSDKIRATKKELEELMASAKEQTFAALKGDKSKFDDDALSDLLDDEFNLDNLEDETSANESVTYDAVSADPGDEFEYVLNKYGKPEKAAAAIFIKMLVDADITGFRDALRDKPEDYLKDLLDAAEVLVDGVNKPQPSEQDKEIERLSKTIANPGIGMEQDSFEDVNSELVGVKSEITVTPVGNLNPQQLEEFNLDDLKALAESYDDALNRTCEDIISSKSFEVFNGYIAAVCKSLLKDTQNTCGFNLNEPYKLVLELVDALSEGTVKDYIPVTVFIGILLNLPSSKHYQTFRDLNTKFNEMFNKMD